MTFKKFQGLVYANVGFKQSVNFFRCYIFSFSLYVMVLKFIRISEKIKLYHHWISYFVGISIMQHTIFASNGTLLQYERKLELLINGLLYWHDFCVTYYCYWQIVDNCSICCLLRIQPRNDENMALLCSETKKRKNISYCHIHIGWLIIFIHAFRHIHLSTNVLVYFSHA